MTTLNGIVENCKKKARDWEKKTRDWKVKRKTAQALGYARKGLEHRLNPLPYILAGSILCSPFIHPAQAENESNILRDPKRQQELYDRIQRENARVERLSLEQEIGPLGSEACKNYALQDLKNLQGVIDQAVEDSIIRYQSSDAAFTRVCSYDKIIEKYGLPLRESRAIMRVESDGDPTVESKTHRKGLFQIADPILKKYGNNFKSRKALAKEADSIFGNYDRCLNLLHHHTGMPILQKLLKKYISATIGPDQFKKDIGVSLNDPRTMIDEKVLAHYQITYQKVSATSFYVPFCHKNGLDPYFVPKVLVADKKLSENKSSNQYASNAH